MSRHDLNARLRHLVAELVEQRLSLGQARQEFERQFIVACIRSNEGNLGRSARALGVHRNTLRNKLVKLDISLDDLGTS